MSRLRWGLFLALVGLSAALAGWGIWLVASYDPQGGRDAAGAIVLVGALVTLVLAALVFSRPPPA